MMLQKGDVIALTSNPETKYLVSERISEIARNESGWICVEMEAIMQKGIENVSTFDCWRITDRYVEVQLKRGEIFIVKE